MDNDGTQVAKLVRMADLKSNRTKRKSIYARATECKIINEGELNEQSNSM